MRVYMSHISLFSIKQQQLFFVLSAYSMYNTEVGYCQGMSQIAALLLMYMSEEVSDSTLITWHLIKDYNNVLSCLQYEILPRIYLF